MQLKNTMILILTNEDDFTTNDVIKWLIVQKKPFLRISENEVFEIKTEKKRIYIQSERNKFYLSEINSIWYRRGGLKFKRINYSHASINHHMNEIQYWLEDYVIKTLESNKHINKQTNSDINKLWVLKIAKEVGLEVPEFFLAENMDEVEIKKTITKTIAGGCVIIDLEDKIDGIMYTSLIKKKLKDKFFISFFQEKIEKDFEVRSFYLNQMIWSFAIFSQNAEQTKLDFRKRNDEKANRIVRYKLPLEVELKICKLMKELDLNSGSLDFIKNGSNFYFLEINPIGQFSNFSILCNENLEQEVANFL